MQIINLDLPKRLLFGNNCLDEFIIDFCELPFRKVMVIADPHVKSALEKLFEGFHEAGIFYVLDMEISKEPTVDDFNRLLSVAEKNFVDAVIGVGGGSVLDIAKLVAALCCTGAAVEQVFGKGKVEKRKLFLACLPTTAGTGSEVSPNAILLDSQDNLKKAVISPHLVPDVTCIDPVLTHSVPPTVTAFTGIDAFTHCVEAFANSNAHPVIDMYALEGIRLLFENLPKAFANGEDTEAREKIALGSMYGGLCLGPVNTAAVHALAYPLGSEYGLAHGLSNAMLLPHVLEYNLPEGVEKYGAMAVAIGVEDGGSELDKAVKGIAKIKELCRKLEIPEKLTDFDIPFSVVSDLAKSALQVQRLLVNNPKELLENDIIKIYSNLF
jgi:alcohol dehydrogenase